MQLVRFSMPIVSQWTEGETSIDEASRPVPISSGLPKDEILERFKEVFTGLGRLKVEPVKIHLTKDAKPVRKMAVTADKSKSSMPQQTCLGR